jgi:hypothetical protein
MYSVYKKSMQGNGFRFQFHEQTSLFGCNSGYIPYLLKATINKDSSEPLKWHVNIEHAMSLVKEPGHSLIINLKPNSTEPNLSLYELVDVWGHSSHGWTPVMFYLRGLFTDEDPQVFDEKDFIRDADQIEDPIFSVTYLPGTVISGDISGRWTAPGPSATNSVLLWPETFNYFSDKAKEVQDRLA